MIIISIDSAVKSRTLIIVKNHSQQQEGSMASNKTSAAANHTIFAASVLNAALSGAMGEMEDYFDESQYVQTLVAHEAHQTAE
tara:strand:- start:145 stop:393 length:249 start_codon:yes stop_codon:yes gene_type:complete